MADTWAVSDLHPDPENRTVFEAMDGNELQDLADSLSTHGLINPITIRPDGTIIAGEQRWRAAQLARLETVPVIVRDVTDEQAEELRLEENLRRRTLKPSETVRAVRRLHELKDVRQGGDTSKVSPANSAPTAREEIAAETGYTPAQVSVLNTLADLIPPLATLLDTEHITQKVAYQLAQLPAEDQQAVARLGMAAQMSAQEAKTLKAKLKALDEQPPIVRVVADPAQAAQIEALKLELHEDRAQKDVEIAQLKQTLETAARNGQKRQGRQAAALEGDLSDEERKARESERRWREDGEFGRVIQRLYLVANSTSAEHASEVMIEFGLARLFLQTTVDQMESGAAWLRDCSRALRQHLGTHTPLRKVE